MYKNSCYSKIIRTSDCKTNQIKEKPIKVKSLGYLTKASKYTQ